MNNAHRQIAAQSEGKIPTESPKLKTKICLASSWRNEFQPAVCIELRQCGFDVYAKECLDNPIAVSGFNSDFEAMKWADCGVLLLPCGRGSIPARGLKSF